MSDRVFVDTKQLRQLASRMAGADRVIGEELVRAGQRSVLAVEQRSKQIVASERRDMGNLVRSITGTVRPIAGGLQLVAGSNAPYAEVVHEGRGEGKKMPPQGVLLPWMRRHDIPDQAEFAIRRKIGRDGIPGIKYFARSFQELRPQIGQEFRQVPARVMARMKGK